MSNPIKAIIVLKEDSGDIGTCGCIVIFLFFFLAAGGGALVTRLYSVITIGEEKTRLSEIQSEKTKLDTEIKNRMGDYKYSSNPQDWKKDKDLLENIKKRKLIQEEENKINAEIQSKTSNNKKDTKTESDLDSNKNSKEINIAKTVELKELSTVTYPATFLTTSDSEFLAADGKETVIPSNTRIKILKRSTTGMLRLEADGKAYLGYESRLSSNLIKAD